MTGRYSKTARVERCDTCSCILGGTSGRHRVAGADRPWCLCTACKGRYEPLIRADARAAIKAAVVPYEEGSVR